MRIITIAGTKGSGKDYFAKILKTYIESKHPNSKIKIYHFADPFKDCLHGIFKYLGVKKEWLYGTDTDKLNIIPKLENPLYPGTPFSVRHMLQWFGTEVFRTLHPDIWVKIACQIIAEEKPDVAIIADLRFDNELDIDEVYKEEFGKYPIAINVKIHTDNTSVDAHASEAVNNIPVGRFDLIVNNDKKSDKTLLEASATILSMVENDKGELIE